ncbi:E3 ubiquitin-protein ligase TRIM33-like [Ruditapes philippinarum]|uniref:E3 ubiquitin-protein ligase TRIM33-like n=1 Tax=Ruditapes philippinarum TaxID=129788 RepID=UPI00295BB14F|nr:E3 ubiquitin-protein ligase TRIM33-like [Ruditapes philippinarum]
MDVSGKITSTSKANLNLYCIPCDTDGLKVPAYGFCQDCKEHLCNSCFQYHRRSRPSRHHVLLEKDAMSTKQTGVDVNADVIIDNCTNHRDKPLEFYCNTHKIVACYVCVTLEHKQCKFDYIPDVSGNVSGEWIDLNKKMKDLVKKCEYNIMKASAATKQLEQSCEKVVEDIRLLRKEINNQLDQMEPRKPPEDTEICVNYERSYNASFPSDKECSNVIGMVMVSATQMVIADYGNKKIKTIDENTGSLLLEETLSSAPHDAIRLPQNGSSYRCRRMVLLCSILSGQASSRL